MWRAVVLLVVAVLVAAAGVVLAGYGSSEDEAAPETTSTFATETTSSADQDDPPASYEELMARLPPFDEPASPEVSEYREAAIGTFFDHCVSPKERADKAAFVRANRKLLDRFPVFRGARAGTEYTSDYRDGNGCPEGLGPPTSFSTTRTYRLPAGVQAGAVVLFYERQLSGWERTYLSQPEQCEQGFKRRDQFFRVVACGRDLSLSAKALPDWEPPPPPSLPPRPYGAQYPLVADADATPEPTSYEVEPGETCERKTTSYAPSVILPPTPGIRAELVEEPVPLGAGPFDRSVLVEWSFDEIHGDCPPTQLRLTIPNPNTGQPPFGIHADVRARSGTQEIPLPDSFSEAYILWASAESVDGQQGRTVSVLIRRER